MNRQAPTETPPVDLDNFSRKRVKMKLVTKANPIRNVETSPLTFSEQVQACCTIAREKLEAGDYDAGCAALRPWWKIGEWPRQQGLSQRAAAELLLTAGT